MSLNSAIAARQQEVAAGARAEPGRGRVRGRALRLVRRVHSFAGLLLLPWVLFFGLSGILFNHPNVGETVEGQRVAAHDLREHSGFVPWRPEHAAQRVIDELNRGRADSYTLDTDYAPHFSGYSVLSAPAPDGSYMLILDVSKANGVLVRRTSRKNADGSSFPTRELALPEYSIADVERHASGLLEARRLPHERELRAHPKIAPELRMRVADSRGQRWNLVYDTRSGAVSGRRADRFPNLGIAQILGNMHKTHHFPFQVGALWFWALFEDLLGAMMVVWSITGLVMWWQVKRTRLAGITSIVVALAIAGFVMSGTLENLTFGDVRAASGPGD